MKSDSPLASHPPPDPAVLETWLRERGAKRHEGIQPRLASDGSGWGVWASEDIARGEICTSPLILTSRDGEADGQYVLYPANQYCQPVPPPYNENISQNQLPMSSYTSRHVCYTSSD